jgi:hypothetical protein
MGRRQFNLRSLFVAMTLLCLTVWGLRAATPQSVLGALAAWTVAGALYGQFRGDRASEYGSVGAVGGAIALVFGGTAIHVAGFISHAGPEPYFKDGFLMETIWYPIFLLLLLAPLCTMGGGIVGLIVMLVGDYFDRPARAERRDDATAGPLT